VMMPTAPLLSTMMYSNVAMDPPRLAICGQCAAAGWASSGA
jgi:hypothetical protein